MNIKQIFKYTPPKNYNFTLTPYIQTDIKPKDQNKDITNNISLNLSLPKVHILQFSIAFALNPYSDSLNKFNSPKKSPSDKICNICLIPNLPENMRHTPFQLHPYEFHKVNHSIYRLSKTTQARKSSHK